MKKTKKQKNCDGTMMESSSRHHIVEPHRATLFSFFVFHISWCRLHIRHHVCVRVGGCGTDMSSLDGGKSVKKSNSMMTIDLKEWYVLKEKESVLFLCLFLTVGIFHSVISIGIGVYSTTKASYSVGKIR
jgi:hypothetical protein